MMNLCVYLLPPSVLVNSKGTTVGGAGRALGLCTKHSTKMVSVCSHHMHRQKLFLSINHLSV